MNNEQKDHLLPSARTEADSSTTAQNQHVSQPNANTNVSSRQFQMTSVQRESIISPKKGTEVRHTNGEVYVFNGSEWDLKPTLRTEHEIIDGYYPTINHVELGELYCMDKVILIMREYAEQFKRCSRFFIDERVGCIAVRDRKHREYNPDYPGLHNDTADVIFYAHGSKNDEGWFVDEKWRRKAEEVLKHLMSLEKGC